MDQKRIQGKLQCLEAKQKHNMRNVTKAEVGGNFIAVNTYIEKQNGKRMWLSGRELAYPE